MSSDGSIAPVEARGGRLESLYRQSGGLVTALLTTLLAFMVGGLVVLFTGGNPFAVYKGIFEGTGLTWLFPWVEGAQRETAAFNLQQTLLLTTTLILTGLAVAFAFRCGLFNIGGQGQWTVGAVTSVWVGTIWADLAGPIHIVLIIVLATLMGALWGGIAGILRATVGTHEVISTIMLNWIAVWVASYFFGRGGPLQGDNPAVPVSESVHESVKLPVFWGDPILQGLHIGFFVALAGLVGYWLLLSRSTLGFKVRAVGRNAEGARYGGIGVGSSYFAAMAISGAFGGLGGAIDILGWQYRLGVLDVRVSTVGFIGIAVALLGRNTAVGVFFAALLFGALFYGTSSRSLDPSVFDPQLAGNLSLMIQALVLVFIGADVLILALWRARGIPRIRLPRFGRGSPAAAPALVAAEPARGVPWGARLRSGIGEWAAGLRASLPRNVDAIGWAGIVAGVLAGVVALPPLLVRTPIVPALVGLAAGLLAAYAVWRGRRRLGYAGLVIAVLGASGGIAATRSSVTDLDEVFLWSALTASTLRFATPMLFAALGGMISERSGVVNIGLEGMMLIGAFFAIYGADRSGSWVVGLLSAVAAGAVLALIHGIVSIHWRADQIVSGVAVNILALGVTGYLLIDLYDGQGTPSGIAEIPNVHLPFIADLPFFGTAIGDLNLMIWVGFIAAVAVGVMLFRTPFGLRLRAVGEHPRAADTVGLSVYRIRYTAVLISGMLAALGGAFLSIGFVHSFSENMTAGRGFIALAAVIIGNWAPRGAFGACLLFGFSSALAQRLPVYSESAATLFQALPYVLTLIVVAGLIGRSVPPASIGIPYLKR